MSHNPREPVVLIPSSPEDRVDPEIGQKVREAVKRSNAPRKSTEADLREQTRDKLAASLASAV